MRLLRNLIDAARWALVGPQSNGHKSWREGDLHAKTWKTYRGYRWEVRDASGELIRADRSRDYGGAHWAAMYVMSQHRKGRM